MSSHRVVVDGSNIATEGRSLPSLVQLDEAVRAYRDEHPDAEIIVVVDATFAHRIDDSERAMFEEAAAHNELVYPPAGAIGRGDAFLLRIADKTDAVVLSNDSFQEFHGEFEWLFTKGRLIGGTPVPGVGWIFVPRTPVRGPKSREAVKEAKRGKARIGSKEASAPMPVPKAPPPRSPKNKDAKGGDNARPAKQGRLKAAIEEATEEAVSGEFDDAELEGDDNGGERSGGKGRKRRRRKGKGAAAAAPPLPTVNEPLTFIQFIADHQPGASVEGEIESFASHGAFVLVGDARCYIPLSAMGDPPPRSAREVLNRGETRTFVVQALDAPRRGIELALPGFAHVAGQPTDETVEAEIGEAPPPIARRGGRGRGAAKELTSQTDARPVLASDAPAPPAKKAAARRASAKKAAVAVVEAAAGVEAPAKRASRGRKVAAPVTDASDPVVAVEATVVKKVAATKKATVRKASARPAAPVVEVAPSTPAKRAATKKAAAAEVAAAVEAAAPAPAKRTAAKKATTVGKAPAKKASANDTAAAKKAPAVKKTAAKKAAVVDKAPAKKVAAKKVAPAEKTTPAKKVAAKKATPAKKASTKKAGS